MRRGDHDHLNLRIMKINGSIYSKNGINIKKLR